MNTQVDASRPDGALQDRERSLHSYFDAFAPAPAWEDLVSRPPDVFALANLVLDHTESYRFAVAPPPGRRWPPLRDWNAETRRAAQSWRGSGEAGGEPPFLVRRSWATVTRLRDVPLAAIRSGGAWELIEALLTLHAIADEACADVTSAASAGRGSFEQRAWGLLEAQGSLSRVSPTRVRIVPKTNFSPRGMTIRSLSRYLGLCYEAVEVRWRSSAALGSAGRAEYNVVLLPWPLSIDASDFRPAPPALLENMDLDRFGLFEFAPEAGIDCKLVASLLETAVDAAGTVDAVVLPEVAVKPTGTADGRRHTGVPHLKLCDVRQLS